MKNKKILILILLLALIALFFILNLGRFFSLDFIKSQQSGFASLYAEKPALVILGFFAAYVAVTALSLPGAAIMTLAAGAIFGLVIGTVIVSFASSIGATVSFLAARFLLGETVQNKFGARLAEINKGVRKRVASTCSPCAWCRWCRFLSSILRWA